MKIMITGATSGIGAALTQHYLEQGHHVLCCGRNAEALAKLEQQYPAQVQTRRFDITDLKETQEQLGSSGAFDVAILNAGTCEYLDMPNFDASAFKRVVDTNLTGVANCLEMVIPQIKSGGRLALVGSSASYLPLPRAEAYGASKAAIEYLAKTLAITLKPLNIGVTYIAPGFVKTPLTDRNDFPMPMRVDTQTAAQRIVRGLKQGKAEVHFPRRFTGLLKVIGSLPFCLQRRLISRLVTRH